MSPAHLDDETLSAVLDGEAGAPTHLAGCELCRGRLDQLRAAAAAVSAPPPSATTAERDRAVARALDAAEGLGRGAAGVLPSGRRPARPRAFPRWLTPVAVAAGVIVLAGAVVGVRVLGHDDADTTAASRQDGRTESAVGAPRGPVGPVLAGGDLGDVADAESLRAKAAPALEPVASAAADESAGAPPPPQGGAKQAPPTLSSLAAPVTCEAQGRALDPAPQRLVYVADARWQGTPAKVLGFAPEGGGDRPGGVKLYVLAAADCRLLSFQSYSP